MTNPLVYDKSTDHLPEDLKLKISPSKFAKFINTPHKFYSEEILEEEGFTYNTSSVMGTIVHHLAELVASSKEINKQDIENYIELHEENEDYCKETVRNNFESVANVLINTYTIPRMGNFLEVETKHFVKIDEGIYAAGTVDIIEGTKDDCMLTDYKTYNSKTKPKALIKDYRIQALVYAYILRCNGYNVTRIRNVYINRNIDGGISEKTGKPLKSYPPEVTEITEVVTDEDMEFIKSVLELCADTYNAGVNYPQLLHVIWKDKRLQLK